MYYATSGKLWGVLVVLCFSFDIMDNIAYVKNTLQQAKVTVLGFNPLMVHYANHTYQHIKHIFLVS